MLNLTQHKATPEQIEAGVIELPEHMQANLKDLLTFDSIPDETELKLRAWGIVQLIEEVTLDVACTKAMIGGAPFLMSVLERALIAKNILPCYAFSLRESVDEKQPDGSVKKVAVFRHKGFVCMESKHD